jgi:DNA-binding transcriptional MocR family regulator
MDHLNQVYGTRIKKQLEILNGCKGANVPVPEGGYFIWVRLEDNVNLDLFKENLEKAGIAVLFGERFIQESDRENQEFRYLRRRFRTSFANMDEESLYEGTQRLREVIEASLI